MCPKLHREKGETNIGETGEDSAWCVYKGHWERHGMFISHWHRNRNRAAAISMRGNAITYH
jgi:hypothetical protein